MHSASGPRRFVRRVVTRCRRGIALLHVRRIWLRRNALRRRSDRVEHVAALAAIAVLLAMVPVVVAIGTTVYRHGLAASALETADRRQVAAVLLEDARPLPGGPSGTQASEPVLARWEWPAGTTHTGAVPAAPGLRAGAPVRPWIDRDGRPAAPPTTSAEAHWHSVSIGFGAALLSFVALAAFLIALLGVVRWRLDRTRLAAWATEWALIGPQWTRRYH